jgi:hypothetical protein
MRVEHDGLLGLTLEIPGLEETTQYAVHLPIEGHEGLRESTLGDEDSKKRGGMTLGSIRHYASCDRHGGKHG